MDAPISRFRREHGGGSSTIKRAQEALQKRELGACLLDTDRLTPYSKSNGLVREAKRLSANYDWPLFFISPLPCHEIENVIPHNVITLLQCSPDCEWNSLGLRISDWECRNGKPPQTSFWLFLDLKNGLNSIDVEALATEEQDWIYERMAITGAKPGDSWHYRGYGRSVLRLLLTNNDRAVQFFNL